jgi:hypothetical protein
MESGLMDSREMTERHRQHWETVAPGRDAVLRCTGAAQLKLQRADILKAGDGTVLSLCLYLAADEPGTEDERPEYYVLMAEDEWMASCAGPGTVPPGSSLRAPGGARVDPPGGTLAGRHAAGEEIPEDMTLISVRDLLVLREKAQRWDDSEPSRLAGPSQLPPGFTDVFQVVMPDGHGGSATETAALQDGQPCQVSSVRIEQDVRGGRVLVINDQRVRNGRLTRNGEVLITVGEQPRDG